MKRVEPEVIELPVPCLCVYCADTLRGRTRGPRQATHMVDGTSVCHVHIPEAIARAMWKRAEMDQSGS